MICAPVSRAALLLPRKLVLAKERPHLTRCVDVAVSGPEQPLVHGHHAGKQEGFLLRLAAWPGMASSPEGVEHHGRVVSTVRVFDAGDTRMKARALN